MLFNAKNVQIDTEKIQEVIEASSKYWLDTDGLIKDGIQGYPILASFGLATVSLPEKDTIANEKTNSKTSVLENLADKLIDIGNSAKNMINNPEGFGVPRFFPNELEINCSYGNGSVADTWLDKHIYRIELTKGFNCFNSANCFEEVKPKMPRHIEKVVKLAEEIKNDFFGPDWIIAIDSKAELTEYINNVELFYRLEDALIEIRNRLKDGKINPPTIHYISLEDVMALNIIKIVDKGTDKESNYYTGNCSSIVFEALVNGKYEMFNGIQLLKTMVRAHRLNAIQNSHIGLGSTVVNVEQFDDVHIVNSKEVNSIMCTRQICTDFISTETMGSLRAKMEADNDPEYIARCQENIVNESKEREEFNTKFSFRNCFYSQIDKCMSNEITHLIIPHGMDLSNSFKAKYN